MKKLGSLMVVAGAPFRATAPQLKGTFKMKSKRLILSVLVALAGFLPQSKAALVMPLGSAGSFAVLGGTAVTFTAPMTTVSGDVGVSPGTSITGAGIGENLTLTGSSAIRNAADAQLAQIAATAAYTYATVQTPTTTYTADDNQLGDRTLFPGVYRFGGATTANLIGTLTLDANGVVDPVWIFQATSDLVTASGSKVNLINGATSCDVFWQISSSATLGSGSFFDGTILAYASITLKDAVAVHGRLLAQTGNVTLIHDTIDVTCVPEPTTMIAGALLLLPFGMSTVRYVRKNRKA